eukprot:NODE_26_length_40862_cov_0.679513.p28 type:complete len:104 gc:universal NODE_26_length_40862_cov_0.679513:7333-7022(-)
MSDIQIFKNYSNWEIDQALITLRLKIVDEYVNFLLENLNKNISKRKRRNNSKIKKIENQSETVALQPSKIPRIKKLISASNKKNEKSISTKKVSQEFLSKIQN